MSVILASASPRRRELLAMLGVKDMKIIPCPYEERAEGLSPEETVKKISLSKAKYVSKQRKPGDIIIAADTLVYLEGAALGKPADEAAAFNMLSALSGKMHSVYTGIALITDGGEISECEKTDVYFREISDSEIRAYIETGEPVDKAGAYGVQGRGAVFVKRIEGDFFNVMGLPLCLVWETLKKSGFCV